MSIKSIFKKIGGSLLPARVILKGKRVIFMTTFYLKMCQSYGVSVTLEECNRQLGLVDNVDALKLPAALQDKVWNVGDEKSLDRVTAAIECGDVSTVNRVVMSITPAWLRYDSGSCNIMRNDIETIVSCVSQRHAAMG
jgi:hypothetical protein